MISRDKLDQLGLVSSNLVKKQNKLIVKVTLTWSVFFLSCHKIRGCWNPVWHFCDCLIDSMTYYWVEMNPLNPFLLYEPHEAQFLVEGFSKVLKLHFKGNREQIVETPNMPSAKDYPEILHPPWRTLQDCERENQMFHTAIWRPASGRLKAQLPQKGFAIQGSGQPWMPLHSSGSFVWSKPLVACNEFGTVFPARTESTPGARVPAQCQAVPAATRLHKKWFGCRWQR